MTAPPYVFYEGPPTANGLPGLHHVLARSYKDVFARYKQMTGFSVARKAGWDTHGLPVELEVERALKISGKKQIEEYGIAEFNARCKASVNEYIDQWREMSERLGFWLDFDHPYRTYDGTYIESVWWSLKELWEDDLLYQGYKVTPYCPRCQTTLSSHELSQGYREDTPDPSVYVKFRLNDSDGTTFLLAWTTTPWTLPGQRRARRALRARPYVRVAQGDESYILAKERLEVLDGDYEILDEMDGSDLVDLHVRAAVHRHAAGGARLRRARRAGAGEHGRGHRHRAHRGRIRRRGPRALPAQGRRDPARRRTRRTVPRRADAVSRACSSRTPTRRSSRTCGSRAISIGPSGSCTPIRSAGAATRRCCTTRSTSWFIRTTAVKDRLLTHNRSVHWQPAHIRDGRMGNWLESLIDWNLSRSRYWGTPLPIWVCEECDQKFCAGSAAEIGLTVDDDLHRPFIDDVTLPCTACKGVMQRVPDVIDCLVRLRRDALRAEALSLREQGAVRAHAPGRLHLRGRGPDPRLVLLAARGVDAALRPRPRTGTASSWGRCSTSRARRCRSRGGNTIEPEHDLRPVRRRRRALVLLRAGRRERRAARQPGVIPGRRPPLHADALERVLVLRDLRAHRGVRPRVRGARRARTPGPRPLVPRRGSPRRSTRFARRWSATTRRTRCHAVEAFVEDLSKWYVRRSRRRFWKSAGTERRLAGGVRDAAHRADHALRVSWRRSCRSWRSGCTATSAVSTAIRRRRRARPNSVHLTDYPKVAGRVARPGRARRDEPAAPARRGRPRRADHRRACAFASRWRRRRSRALR